MDELPAKDESSSESDTDMLDEQTVRIVISMSAKTLQQASYASITVQNARVQA